MRWNFVRGRAVALAVSFSLALAGAVAHAGADTPSTEWRTLEPGLDYGEFAAPTPATIGNSKIAVTRIDPARFQLDLLSASVLKLPQPLTIDAWTAQYHLLAATNAGMYEPNGLTVGYARVDGVTVKPAWKPNYGAVLAIGPDDPKLPAATILDPDCDDVHAQEKHYRIVLQSMRMISCKGTNLWPKSPRIWSTSAVAIDGEGRVLFIQARSPWDVHDFIDILQKLPLGITRAMYLEGGPEASLSVAAGGVSKTLVGSYETGFNENDENVRAWVLPNVLGVSRIIGED